MLHFPNASVLMNHCRCCRLFGMKRCGRCQAAILASELVMRAREMVYHVHCFTCAVCQTALTKGDTFGMRDGAVFCRLHYQELPPAPSDLHYHPHPMPLPLPHPHLGTPPLPPTPPDPSKVPSAFFNGAPAPRQKGRPRKRKPKDLESMTANLGEYCEYRLNLLFISLHLL